MRYIWVGLAGAIGCTLRYAIDLRVDQTRFPWATLAINLSGAFVLALFLTLALGRVSVEVMTPISIGLLGGYTTFSTFAFESFTMSRNGRPRPRCSTSRSRSWVACVRRQPATRSPGSSDEGSSAASESVRARALPARYRLFTRATVDGPRSGVHAAEVGRYRAGGRSRVAARYGVLPARHIEPQERFMQTVSRQHIELVVDAFAPHADPVVDHETLTAVVEADFKRYESAPHPGLRAGAGGAGRAAAAPQAGRARGRRRPRRGRASRLAVRGDELSPSRRGTRRADRHRAGGAGVGPRPAYRHPRSPTSAASRRARPPPPRRRSARSRRPGRSASPSERGNGVPGGDRVVDLEHRPVAVGARADGRPTAGTVVRAPHSPSRLAMSRSSNAGSARTGAASSSRSTRTPRQPGSVDDLPEHVARRPGPGRGPRRRCRHCRCD